MWAYQIGVFNKILYWHTLREIVQLERVEERAGHMAGVLDNGLAVEPFAPLRDCELLLRGAGGRRVSG